MAESSAIEWTDATWTPIRARWFAPTNDGGGIERVGWHCEHVSEGCRNCYAETINRRLGTQLEFKPANLKRQIPNGDWRGEADLFLDEKMLLAPLRWRRPRMIFVCSMTDLFADFVPDAMIDCIFGVMALCPQHTFQVLTKRPERMRAWFAQDRPRTAPAECVASLYVDHPDVARLWPFNTERAIGVGQRGWPLPNVWLGTSCEDQATADARVPELLATPAAIRFVSAEPLLGPIMFESAWCGENALDSECWGDCDWCTKGYPALHNCIRRDSAWANGRSGLDWIIVGGESGPKARPMHPDWARCIRDECVAAGVPFFFKQWGGFRPIGAIFADDSPAVYDADVRRSLILCGDGTIWPDDGGQPAHDDAWMMERVGKHRAGRFLDGVEHNGMPVVPDVPTATPRLERTA